LIPFLKINGHTKDLFTLVKALTNSTGLGATTETPANAIFYPNIGLMKGI
jgi:hypothetical protein